MSDDVQGGKRKVLTLAWRVAAGIRPELVDDYVQLDEPARQRFVPTRRAVIPVVQCMEDEFERRMTNWRNTLYNPNGGGGGGCCAAWARWYVVTRDMDENALRRFIEPDLLTIAPRISVDELDGWLVEAAVRTLPIFEDRQVLRMHYVFRYPEHWIKTKLLLRNKAVRLVLARAQGNLKKVLQNLKPAANILANKLHAGTDPRPESIDAHVGASLTLKNEALTS